MDAPPPELFPEEEELIRDAAAGRRHEFAWGRTCARRALGRLGVAPGPITRDNARKPIWPASVVGSISHCRDHCVAAVAPADRWSAIGIDIEPIGRPLEAGVIRVFAGPQERAWLANVDLPGAERIVFSAKESVYKAWYAMTARWLDFADVVITVDLTARRFAIAMPGHAELAADRLRACGGWFALDTDLVWTAVAVPRAS